MAKPTINDVARLAGVSKKTVSRVINRSPLLNAATRAKVEGVIADLGYVPNPQARALALRRNFLIALVYDPGVVADLLDVQHAMLAALADSDFALVPCPLGPDAPGDLRRFLERHRPYGAAFLPPLPDRGELAELCRQNGCRYAALGARGEADGGERAGAALAVNRLVELGHSRIGLVAGPEDSTVARDCELGYLDAMAEHGLDRGPSLVAVGDWSHGSGHAAGRLLLEVSPRPTAIIAGNVQMAAGIYEAAGEAGVPIPQRLSIVALGDDAQAEALQPRLSTMQAPLVAGARRVALELAGLADPDEEFSPPAPQLVERDSLAPAA